MTLKKEKDLYCLQFATFVDGSRSSCQKNKSRFCVTCICNNMCLKIETKTINPETLEKLLLEWNFEWKEIDLEVKSIKLVWVISFTLVNT